VLGLKSGSLEPSAESAALNNAVVLRISGRSVKALIDSGNSRNCISERSFLRLKLPYSALNKRDLSPLVFASDAPLKSMGTVTLDVSIQGLSIPIVFFVILNLSISCILGINCLQDSHAILDCSANVLYSYDGLVVAPLICNFDRDSILFLSRSLILPLRSETLSVKVHKKFIGQTLLVEGWPALRNRMIAVAAALIKPQMGKSLCRVVNAGDTPKGLRVNSPVATVSYLPIDAHHNANLLPPANFSLSPQYVYFGGDINITSGSGQSVGGTWHFFL